MQRTCYTNQNMFMFAIVIVTLIQLQYKKKDNFIRTNYLQGFLEFVSLPLY